MKSHLTLTIAIALSLAASTMAEDRCRTGREPGCPGRYLGQLSSNPYAPDSTANKYGRYGSPYSAESIRNPYSQAGQAARNPFGGNSPIIVGEDGNYLGKLNNNRFDADSVANPFGRYGSRYSPESINNPYGKYGNPYSTNSTTNPYATQAPKLYLPQPGSTLTPDLDANPLIPRKPKQRDPWDW